ncbi:fimbrial [Escherichia coli]|nr:fimbrial [Escherichia coli]
MRIAGVLIFIVTITLQLTHNNSIASEWQNSSILRGETELSGRLIYINGELKPRWLWKTGGYTDFHHHISDISGGKRLTIVAPNDILLLAGKSQASFDGGAAGTGIVPVIQFITDGVPVSIQWESGSQGKGVITLPIHHSVNDRLLGTLSAYVQAFGALAWAEYDGFGAKITQTLGDNTSYPYVFNGGLMGANTWTTRSGLEFLSRMTGDEINADILWLQLKEKIPGLSENPVISNESGYQDLVGSGWLYSGGYSLGINSGDTLELFFSSEITEETMWHSRLTVNIIYA